MTRFIESTPVSEGMSIEEIRDFLKDRVPEFQGVRYEDYRVVGDRLDPIDFVFSTLQPMYHRWVEVPEHIHVYWERRDWRRWRNQYDDGYYPVVVGYFCECGHEGPGLSEARRQRLKELWG